MGPVPLEVNAGSTYGATFSFAIPPFDTRRVYIDTACYNTTGNLSTSTSILSPPIGGFPAWADNYATSPWIQIKPITGFPLAFQADQISVSNNSTLATDDLVFAFTEFGTGLRIYTFDSEADIPDSPKGSVTATSSATAPSISFGIAPALGGVHLFWTTGTPGNLYHVLYDGTLKPTAPPLATGLKSTRGASACRINEYSDRLLGVAIVPDNQSADLATQARVLILSESDVSIVTNIIVDTGDIDSDNVSITQNPRTGIITLGYISGTAAKAKNFIYSGGTLTETAAPVIGSTWSSAGNNVQGFPNFETSFIGIESGGTFLRDAALYTGNALVGNTAVTPGWTSFFHYNRQGEANAGLLVRKQDFSSFEFWRRPLVFPTDCGWDASSRVLHLEGPPFPGTKVTVTAFFPELLTASCTVAAVNGAGGALPLDQPGLRLIASAGALIKLAFTGDMMTASFPAWVGNTDGKQIRMYGPASAPISLAYQSADSRSVTFSAADDLQFNTTYYIQIASDVLGVNGTQLWEAATGTLQTQLVNSGILASEVIAIEAFRDAGRTVQIPAGSEISASATLYLRLRAKDPAYNTIDLATATYSLDGVSLATLPFTQPVAATETFLTSAFTTSVSYGQPHTLIFQTASSTASLTLRIAFPLTAPLSPASGSTNIPTTAAITIQADEALDPGSIDGTTVRLLQSGTAVPATHSWDAGSRVITVTPTPALLGSTLYTVESGMVRDLAGNPQVATLSYTFTTADITPPELVTQSPASGSTGVTIDRNIILTLSEPVATPSVTATTVRLVRSGSPASYSVSLSGAVITIDPDDAPNAFLRIDTTYTVEIGAGVRDLSGNAFSNVPATYSATFRTQPASTPPSAASSFTLFRDSGFIDAFSAGERVSATAAVYLKFTGTDGATQTRDILDTVLRTSWGQTITIPLAESASNSGGLYFGNYTLTSIPIFNFTGTLPPSPIATLSWEPSVGAGMGATLTTEFPNWTPAQTTVQTLSGSTTASGATSVRLDTPISVAFSAPLDAASVGTASLQFTGPAGVVTATRTVSADKRSVTITPAGPLSPSSTYRVQAEYASTGLRSPSGNPIYRSFAFTFTTQAAQTKPLSISSVGFFPDATWDPFSRLATDADCAATGTLFLEMRGQDASNLTIDAETASLSTGGIATLVETATDTGIYRGSFTVNALADGFRLVAASTVSPTASAALLVTYPKLSITFPASGSIAVSISADIILQASEDLDQSTVNTANIVLRGAGTPLAAAVTYATDTRRIVLRPAAQLVYNLDHTVSISGLRDTVGNPFAGQLTFGFRTQSSTVPPATILGLTVFSDPAFTAALTSGSAVLPGQELFIRVSAIDLSPSTFDATSVRLSSSLNLASPTAPLVETTQISGVFQGSMIVPPESGALLTLESVTDPTFARQFRTPVPPQLTGITPASGTANLAFDTIFRIQTSKPVDAATLVPGAIRLADSRGYLTASMSLPAPREIAIEADLATFSGVVLEVTDAVKDTDGLGFPAVSAVYSTLSPAYGPLTLYSDAGYTQQIPDGTIVDPGATIRVRLAGTDTRTRRLESLSAASTDGIATSTFSITEITGGDFRGSLVVPNSPGATLTVSLPFAAAVSRSVSIRQRFLVTQVAPADGAVAVPADTWPTWRFSQPLSPAAPVDSAHFQLLRMPAGTPVAGTVAASTDRMAVEFIPNSFLSLLTAYRLVVKGTITDAFGQSLGSDHVTNFTSQPPPEPPSLVSSLRHYRDAAFATQWHGVIPGDALYLEVRAADVSFSTIDSTRVRIDASDGSFIATEVVLLEETGPNTGIFRRILPTTAAEGESVTVRSQADSSFRLSLPVFFRPRITGIIPASGSTGIWLDQLFTISFDKQIDPAGVASGGIHLNTSSGVTIPVTAALSQSGNDLSIAPAPAWATGTQHIISLKPPLCDTDGVPVNFTIYFTSRAITEAIFQLYSGIGSRAGTAVSPLGEALPGGVHLTASATDLLGNHPETRLVRIAGATGTVSVVLTEVATAPGRFEGDGFIPFQRGSRATATLELGSRPSIPFLVAPVPTLTGVQPASGSTTAHESSSIFASFSRPIDLPAVGPLSLNVNGAPATAVLVTPGASSRSLQWQPGTIFLPGSLVEVSFPALHDLLGQTLSVPSYTFTAVGAQGMTIFTDSGFTSPLTGDIVNGPSFWVEVAASGPVAVPADHRILQAFAQRTATYAYLLPLDPVDPTSRRFRGRIDLEDARGISSITIPVVPGERVDLACGILTSQSKYIYYRTIGDTQPGTISGMTAYSDSTFRQPIDGSDLSQTMLYLEIEAEDLNWLNADTTRVRVVSDSDVIGFRVTLVESAPHSGLFRATIAIRGDGGPSNPATAQLSVMPGETFTLTSVTDPRVRLRLRYQPQTRLDHLAVWPSPARGNQVTFSFWLTSAASVEVKIYDVSGEEVGFLEDSCRLGENRLTWQIPRRFANGAYMYVLEVHPETNAPIKKRKFKGKFAVLR